MIKASVYRSDGEAVISVANWTDHDQVTALKIDWASLGMDPGSADIFIPEITGLPDRTKIRFAWIKLPFRGKRDF